MIEIFLFAEVDFHFTFALFTFILTNPFQKLTPPKKLKLTTVITKSKSISGTLPKAQPPPPPLNSITYIYFIKEGYRVIRWSGSGGAFSLIRILIKKIFLEVDRYKRL